MPPAIVSASVNDWPPRGSLRAAFLVGLSLLLFPGRALGSGVPQTKKPLTKALHRKAPQTKPLPSSGRSSVKAHSGKHSRSKAKSRSSRVRERAQRAPTPERISEVQSALARSGHYSGQPTGKWDASTAQAMKKYQVANGLPPTGKLDAHTLQKLGLGSPIAGVAAPRPPAAPPAEATSPTSRPTPMMP